MTPSLVVWIICNCFILSNYLAWCTNRDEKNWNKTIPCAIDHKICYQALSNPNYYPEKSNKVDINRRYLTYAIIQYWRKPVVLQLWNLDFKIVFFELFQLEFISPKLFQGILGAISLGLTSSFGFEMKIQNYENNFQFYRYYCF